MSLQRSLKPRTLKLKILFEKIRFPNVSVQAPHHLLIVFVQTLFLKFFWHFVLICIINIQVIQRVVITKFCDPSIHIISVMLLVH